ncbi:MAG: hypothetical protein HC819_15570 [Cyclobacteriaceae bacterium]|nr:hypothetical protein [Cyclobacteriaceae bacterium]
MRGTYSERYEGLQLKIESKMLKSGKCQVKFITSGLLGEDFYGYALMDAEKPLLDIVREIKDKLTRVGSINNYYQQNLFSINGKRPKTEDFVIFKS